MLAATNPLFVPDDDRSAALETLTALVRARLAFRDDVLTFAARVGCQPCVIDTWLDTGLVQRGAVVVDAAEGRSAEVLAATVKGARELSAATGTAWKGRSSSRFRLSGRKLVHDATIGSVALAVLAAARDGAIDLRGIETDDHLLGTSGVMTDERGTPTRVPLQSDAYALVHEGGTLRGLLIEVDRATTSAARVAAKYAAYAAWQRQGGPERTFGVKAIRILTLVPDDRRLARLKDETLAAIGRPSALFLFATFPNVSPRDPEKLFEPIATNLAGGVEPIFRRAA
jgi:hypothetical protein